LLIFPDPTYYKKQETILKQIFAACAAVALVMGVTAPIHAGTAFSLKHKGVDCAACHKTQTPAQPAAQDACIGYLRRQVALLRPKIIVCLGRIAAMRIIKPDFKITREHGQWFEKNGFQMMAVYHPAALLRDPRRRPESFEDFKGLQQKINELCEHTHAVS